jgi:hypothetical protein
VIGAVVGGVGLAAVGAAYVGLLCEGVDSCRSDSAQALLLGGVVGGAAGAVVGAGVGSLFRTWRRVYP